MQTSIKKSDGSLEPAGKKQKIDPGNGSTKAVDSRSTNNSISRECQDAGKSLERSSLVEIQVSPSSKAHPTTMQQSAQTVKQISRTPASYPNKFKLDNRPTSFRILPPLPVKLGNVSLLTFHFFVIYLDCFLRIFVMLIF